MTDATDELSSWEKKSLTTRNKKETGTMEYKNQLIQFFAYEHLPEHLQAASKPFGDLARQLEETLPSGPEKTVAFRKLLEAKDCAVRAVLFKTP